MITAGAGSAMADDAAIPSVRARVERTEKRMMVVRCLFVCGVVMLLVAGEQ